jgi:glycerol dehydrogenase-like iron-containing ADH family enzyme
VRGVETEEFHVAGISDRVSPYVDCVGVDDLSADSDELVERAATLLVVMPPNQRRSTIEQLLAPHDPERARRAVDALIESAYAVEDDAGHLRRAS